MKNKVRAHRNGGTNRPSPQAETHHGSLKKPTKLERIANETTSGLTPAKALEAARDLAQVARIIRRRFGHDQNTGQAGRLLDAINLLLEPELREVAGKWDSKKRFYNVEKLRRWANQLATSAIHLEQLNSPATIRN